MNINTVVRIAKAATLTLILLQIGTVVYANRQQTKLDAEMAEAREKLQADTDAMNQRLRDMGIFK